MAVYFADTAFWIALVDRRDAFHAQATAWSLHMSGRVVAEGPPERIALREESATGSFLAPAAAIGGRGRVVP